jgi:Leucine-rich repeat (LRR) protein
MGNAASSVLAKKDSNEQSSAGDVEEPNNADGCVKDESQEAATISKKKRWILLGLVIIVVIAIVIAAFAGSETGDSTSVSSNSTDTGTSLTWIKDSTVETAAQNLPPSTVGILKEELGGFAGDVNDAKPKNESNWYTNGLWVSPYFNPQSSQARAWKWIVSDPTVADYEAEEVTTRFALAVLFLETSGEYGWTNRTNWMRSDQHVCTWYSSAMETSELEKVYMKNCYKDGFRVLALIENGLQGSLPPETGLLTGLETLFIMDNDQLRGKVNPLLSLFNLDKLVLSGNALTGTIPSDIKLLSSLIEFNLAQNSFTGSLPSGLGDLSMLQTLDLGLNMLAGELPSSLGNLVDLVTLMLPFNELTGSLPTFLQQLTRLESLVVSKNRMGGALSDDLLGAWKNMKELGLGGGNSFTGPIPSELWQREDLQHLDLSQNMLTGTLPDDVGLLSNLVTLDASNNRISGSLPDGISKLKKLSTIDLSFNRFTGKIPDNAWEAWKSAFEVSLHLNTFTGTVSTNIGLLSNARAIVLIRNSLSGSIPSEVGMLSNLERLIISSNPLLTGSVPHEACALTKVVDGGEDPLVIVADCDKTLSCDCCECA